MKETQEEITLSEHIYESDKTYMIPVKGNQLLHWIDVLGLIVEKGASGNGQLQFGADVINRIVYAIKKNNIEKAKAAVVDDTLNMLINELIRFINDNGVKGTDIFVELCAVPDKIPFYEKFGFEANEAQRLKIYHRVK